MSSLLFILVVVGLTYAVVVRPGTALAYILFGQQLNNLLFKSVGLTEYRYFLDAIVLAAVIFLHFRRSTFQLSIANLASHSIGLGYILLTLYVTSYGMLIGGAYEQQYMDEFIVPGLALFLIGALAMFNREMYGDLVIGIVACLALVSFHIYGLGDIETIRAADRRQLVGLTGVGAIAQGRMGGVLAIIGMVMLWDNRNGLVRALSVGIMVLGVGWMGWIGTRGALFAFLCATLLYLFCTPRNLFVKLALAIVITAILYVGISETLLVERVKGLLEPGTIEQMSRVQRFSLFLELLPRHFMFGLGPGGWGKYIQLGDYPHNMFIELFIEYGLTGLLVFVLVMKGGVKTVMSVVKSQDVDTAQITIALLWVYYAAAVMFSGDLIGNAEFFSINGVVTGMAVHAAHQARTRYTTLRAKLPAA